MSIDGYFHIIKSILEKEWKQMKSFLLNIVSIIPRISEKKNTCKVKKSIDKIASSRIVRTKVEVDLHRFINSGISRTKNEVRCFLSKIFLVLDAVW